LLSCFEVAFFRKQFSTVPRLFHTLSKSTAVWLFDVMRFAWCCVFVSATEHKMNVDSITDERVSRLLDLSEVRGDIILLLAEDISAYFLLIYCLKTYLVFGSSYTSFTSTFMMNLLQFWRITKSTLFASLNLG
jgi:hypothetical protein